MKIRVYPWLLTPTASGQNHVLRKPSYNIDRLKRYLDWYAKWLGPAKSAAP